MSKMIVSGVVAGVIVLMIKRSLDSRPKGDQTRQMMA